MLTTGQAAESPRCMENASDGNLDRKTPKGGRSRHAQQIPIVGSGFRLFYSTSFRAKAAFHRAPKGRRDRAPASRKAVRRFCTSPVQIPAEPAMNDSGKI